jgi:hypothetical protein
MTSHFPSLVHALHQEALTSLTPCLHYENRILFRQSGLLLIFVFINKGGLGTIQLA